MSVNDISEIGIDDSRVTLQIVASLTDDSWGIIYDCKPFIVQAPGGNFMNILIVLTYSHSKIS